MKKSLILATATLAIAGLALTGCAGGAETGGDVVIGASLPLTGPLQAFGTSLQTGYEKAIAEVNDAGGLEYAGSKHKIVLDVQDNASDATKAGTQAKSLVLDDNAIALLGPATPPLTNAVSAVADQLQVPMISTITPVESWLMGSEKGYTYAWNVFFAETQMTETAFQAAETISTNKKVAILTDTGENLIQENGWTAWAAKYGYDVVYHAEFAPDNTNFSTQVAEAKASGADIVLTNLIPPTAVAFLKEMKAQSYDPQMLVIEKAGNTGGFVEMTGGLGQGVLASNWFAEGMGLPDEQKFIDEFKSKVGGVNSDLGTIVYGYSITKVLLDAIKDAGSTEPQAVNTSISKTDADYPAGHIAFSEKNAAVLPVVQTQWVDANQIMVTNQDGKATKNKITTPVPGLQ
ncbi:MAG: ABC transporter substrate-binding protein [Microbacteriaceae bacterium]